MYHICINIHKYITLQEHSGREKLELVGHVSAHDSCKNNKEVERGV